MPRPSRRILAAAAALLALAACKTNSDHEYGPVAGYVEELFHTGRWKQMVLAEDAKIAFMAYEQDLNFAGGAKALGSSQMALLDDFLAVHNVGGDDRVVLLAPRQADGKVSKLTSERLQGVRGDLRKRGFNAEIGRPSATRVLAPDEMIVLVGRLSVVSPDCTSEEPAAGQYPETLLGCAVTANLGPMLANPNDLKAGRSLGSGDGTMQALGVERYRKNEITPLDEEATTSE